jgi:hypothetical protein
MTLDCKATHANIAGRTIEMTSRRWIAVLPCVLVMSAVISGSLLAHHSFATQYDINKPIEIRGTVTKVEWTNPHARFYLDVKDEQGEVSNWNVEMASPNVLVRNGWKPNTLKLGDQITVGGYMARTAPRMAIAGAITDAQGRALFASAQADLPQR